MQQQLKTRRGDTIIEVMFGIAIFSLVSIMTINLMNNGLSQAENNLESTMARNEMDAQASAINYIHSSYSYSNRTAYANIWEDIKDHALDTYSQPEGGSDCSAYYNLENAFAINISNIRDEADDDSGDDEPPVIIENLTTDEDDEYAYPVVEDNEAHGLWINAVKGPVEDGTPLYYDFYITTCWYGTGASTSSTLDTAIRLYNPDRGF